MSFSRRPNRIRNPQENSSGLPNWAVVALLALFVGAAAFASYMVYATVKEWVATGGTTNYEATINRETTELAPTPPSKKTTEEEQEIAATPVAETVGTPVPTYTGLRTTVLLMGIDQRTGMEDERAFRTDTMMLVTVDKVSNTAGMLSIPRDLWVTIPGFEGRDRINTANFKGDAVRLPGGGPALALSLIHI